MKKLKTLLKLDGRSFLKDTVYFIAGSILYALGLYTFALNAGFATGGVSGISLIINHFFGLPLGVVTMTLNVPIILVCGRILGLPFMFKSVYSMLINTLFLDVVFPLFPTYSGNPLLAAMFTGVLMGAGLAIIYMRGSSTGGTDFITMSVKKLRPQFSVGQIGMSVDIVVILAGGLAFSQVDAVLYGIVCSFASTITMDNLLYGAGSSKMAMIITTKGQAIAEAISDEIERGSTLVEATGTYTGETREMLYCICSKGEIYKVRNAARAIDPDSLLMVTEASEVLGEGFKPPKLPGNEDPALLRQAAAPPQPEKAPDEISPEKSGENIE